MENINTIVIKKISPAETLKSIAVGETRLIKSKAIKENVVRATMSRLNKIGYNFISRSGVDGTIVTRSDNNLLRISKMKKANINYGKVQPVNKIWLSREEAMRFLGCADDYLRKVRESGQVSFCRDGRMIWYNVNSLQRYIENHKVI